MDLMIRGKSSRTAGSSFVVAIVFLLGWTGCGEAEDGVFLIRDGKPQAAIFVTPTAADAIRFAAEELRRYVRKMSGGDMPILSSSSSDLPYTVRIGLPGDMPNFKQPDPPLGPEEFALQRRGNEILVVGGDDLGAVYAAYALLEELGCRFFLPFDWGEVVPESRGSVRVRQLDKVERPDFRVRWVGMNEWSLKNRQNVNVPVGRDGKQYGVALWEWFHTHFILLPPSVYFKEHPEFYSLVRGERRPIQLCTSNEAVVTEITKNLRKAIDENPDKRVFAFSPQDGGGWCECEKCTALDEDASSPGHKCATRLMTFNIAVADAIHRSHPNAMLKVGAYSTYLYPAKDGSLVYPENVVVHIAPIGRTHNVPVYDEGFDYHRITGEVLRAWKGRCKRSWIFEYYYKPTWAEMLDPICHIIAKDIPYYHKMGAEGFMTQHGATQDWWASENSGTLGLVYYVTARLLWDIDRDIDDLLRDFCEKFYAEAAEPMGRFYDRLEQAMREVEGYTKDRYEMAPAVFTRNVLNECETVLTEAEKIARHPLVKKRISVVKKSFAYTKGLTDAIEMSPREGIDALKALEPLMASGIEEGIFARCGLRKLREIRRTKEIAYILAPLPEGEPAVEWNTPAARKLPVKLAFVRRDEPSEEETEALRWARNNCENVDVLYLKEQSFVGEDGQPRELSSYPIVWIHSAPRTVCEELKQKDTVDALMQYLKRGGSVFVSANGLLYCNMLGVETAETKTSNLTGYERVEGFHVLQPNHAIFSGLKNELAADQVRSRSDRPATQINFRAISKDERWGEPRWDMRVSVRGEWVAGPWRYPGKTIVEYRVGRGKVIAAGLPYWGVFSDERNRFYPNVNRLTRNIIAYLANIKKNN